jgi:hypothetical protein
VKRIVAGIIIAMIGCVSIPAWVDAQPRYERGRSARNGRGYGGGRGERRSYRGRSQRRRYYGGRWEWYEDPVGVGRALGGFFGGLFRGPPQEEVIEERGPVRDMAWCMHRYKSYDPYTKTYLGYDGLRHGCP